MRRTGAWFFELCLLIKFERTKLLMQSTKYKAPVRLISYFLGELCVPWRLGGYCLGKGQSLMKSKSSHGKGAKGFYLHRYGEETEVRVWQRVEVAKVLDDWNLCGEEKRMRRTFAATGVVDVERINAYQSRLCADEELRGLGG